MWCSFSILIKHTLGIRIRVVGIQAQICPTTVLIKKCGMFYHHRGDRAASDVCCAEACSFRRDDKKKKKRVKALSRDRIHLPSMNPCKAKKNTLCKHQVSCNSSRCCECFAFHSFSF